MITRRRTSVVAALVLVAQMLVATPALAKPGHAGRLWTPPITPSPSTPKVPTRPDTRHPATPAAPAIRQYHPAKVALPAAGTVSVDLVGARAGVPRVVKGHRPDPEDVAVPASTVRVGASPLYLTSGGGDQRVSVTFAGNNTATKAGVHSGLAWQVNSAAPGARVKIGLDTAALGGLSGGNFAQRLRLVQMPACALTTPSEPACQASIPVAATTDPQTGRLTATVTVPPTPGAATASSGTAKSAAITAGAMTVLAAQSAPAGSAGTYSATSTKPSDQWSQGGATGGFDYSYPISVPPALGGSAPDVSLSYASQDVDGLTASTNSQSSWIGSGWSYAPGYIERAYMPCSDDGISGSGDLCWGWGGAEVSLNQAGMGGQLVKDDAAGNAWRISSDIGDKVQLVTGASNGGYQGEYWVVTTQNGTRYYYGANHLPSAEGGTGADPATNSAWTQPVYCPKSADPCYDSSTGTNSFATNMTYRWNLDYVVDPHGNATVYYYTTEQNNYARGSAHTLTAYTRSGSLSKINYGWRTADVKTQTTPAPAAQVVFNVGQRCAGSQSECSSFANLTSSTKADWPDTPFDLLCASSGTCTNYSPSFFSTVELQSIVTKVNKAGTLTAADTYTLSQSFPDPGDGTSPSLWLNQITHTGNSATPNVTLPAVKFTPTNMLPNRVPGSGTWPGYNHVRMYTIDDETGGHIEVTYTNTTPSVRACDQTPGASVLPTPSNDTMLCYEQYWTPPVGPANDDWFEKYVLAKVIVRDNVIAGSPARETDYTYGGTPAWHRNDSVTTKNSQRGWNVFRGFATVTATTGTAPDPITQITTKYLRGMDGDYQSQTGGTPRSVTVSDSIGDTVTDANQYADAPLEVDTYSAAGATVQAKSVTLPWSSQTASHAETSQPGLPAQKAFITKTGTTIGAQLLASGSWRTVKTVDSFDAVTGLPSRSDDQGDVSLLGTADSQETCSTTTYATPPSSGVNAGMVSYTNRMLRVAVTTGGPVGTGPCPAPTGTNSLTDALAFYDGSTTPGVIPNGGAGNVTRTDVADSYSGNTPTYGTKVSAATYDVYGRVTGNTDARGLVTSATFTPATGQLPTSVTATDVTDGWSGTTTLDQVRQQPTKVVDVNGNTTQEAYDSLGRLTSVWLPGMGKLQPASYVYLYGVNGSGSPSWTETKTLRGDGSTYDIAFQVLNGFGETRQTQTISLDDQNTSLVTDSFYDSHGWASKTTNPYPSSSFPSSTLVATADSKVPAETLPTYDGRGRAVSSGFYSYANLQWQSTTAYPGADRTDVTPPSGGTATTTFTDALGRTTALWNYKTATATGNPADAAIIGYTYTSAGKPATITGPGGQSWSYGYDLHGNPTSSVDPDAGSSSSSFNLAGDLLTTTDANNQTITFTYDKHGRKINEYAGTTSGTLLASWTYDTATGGKNQPATSTSYVGGATGLAYTTAITGYTNRNAATGSSVTIPDSAQLPAGQQPLKGTYSVTDTYNTYNGAETSVAYNADGGLPAETVNFAYTGEGLLGNMGSSLGSYLTGVQIDPYGRYTRWTLGAMPVQVAETNNYDLATGALTEQFIDKETGSTHVDDTVALHNQAGQVTATTDTEDGTATDRQCYTYDHLGQLTEAWTDNGGVTTAPSPSVPNIGSCNTTTPTAANLGGPAPYWQTYHYNASGNRDTETDHDPAGVTANDIGRTYNYNGVGHNPDRLQNQTHTGPGAGTDGYAYDATGQTKTRAIAGQPTQTFDYTPQHNTKTVTDTNGNTADYIYDADGSLLIQTDTKAGATTTTLYLGGEQLVVNSGSSTVHGTRYYSTAGGPTIIRTSDGELTYELANAQNTSSLTITADAAQTESRRHFTPYGAPRGTTPSTWIDNRQFLNQPSDTTTGLGLLGARNYDPATGRFLQIDPVLETTDPNQLGGYTYSGNNPTGQADPSGTDPCSVGGQGCIWYPQCKCYAPPGGAGYKNPPSHDEDTGTGGGGGGSGNGNGGNGGNHGGNSCDWHCMSSKKAPLGVPKAALYSHGYGGSSAYTYQDAVNFASQDEGSFMLVCLYTFNRSEDDCKASDPWTKPVSAGKPTARQAVETAMIFVVLAVVVGCVAADAEVLCAVAAARGGQIAAGGIIAAVSGDPNMGGDPVAGCSFAAQTPVLMADGTAKPIGDIGIGDQVLATDPDVGDTENKPVTILHDNLDTDLADLVVADDHGHTETIHTTQNHPFWDATTKKWTRTDHLQRDDHLQSPRGAEVLHVVNVRSFRRPQHMYNLTVADIHTYYVLAGNFPVLVHNTDGCLASSPAFKDDPYSPEEVEKRIADGRQAWAAIPREVHQTVNGIESGAVTQRVTSAGPDWYRANGNLKSPWRGATIFTGVKSATTETRVLVAKDGTIGFVLGHNYNTVIPYGYAKLPQAYVPPPPGWS